MIERLEAIENRYEELNMRLADPSIMNDQEQYLKLMKEHSDLTEIVEKFRYNAGKPRVIPEYCFRMQKSNFAFGKLNELAK